jgi:hypothetical protein
MSFERPRTIEVEQRDLAKLRRLIDEAIGLDADSVEIQALLDKIQKIDRTRHECMD